MKLLANLKILPVTRFRGSETEIFAMKTFTGTACGPERSYRKSIIQANFSCIQ
jgi:hypothetical protein